MSVHASQIDSLLDSIPASVPPAQRRRLDGYAAAAHRCDQRIAALRKQVADAITNAGIGGEDHAADAVIDAMLELQALEAVQLRLDAGLRASAGALAGYEDQHPVPAGEGPV